MAHDRGVHELSWDTVFELGFDLEVNRTFFHPRGLELARKEDGSVVLLSIDDPVICYAGSRWDQKATSAARDLDHRLARRAVDRVVHLGALVQPLPCRHDDEEEG